MAEKIFAEYDGWAIGADNLQWILYRRRNHPSKPWAALSFVSSTLDILERCCREKGAPPAVVRKLLADLPSTFNEWKNAQRQPACYA